MSDVTPPFEPEEPYPREAIELMRRYVSNPQFLCLFASFSRESMHVQKYSDGFLAWDLALPPHLVLFGDCASFSWEFVGIT